MTINFNELSIFELRAGKHGKVEDGVCAMEAVAWLEGLPHSDAPECTCPVIAAFVRTINDRMLSEARQGLVPYLPRLVGTVSPEHELERATYLAWHGITVILPPLLQDVGLNGAADMLRTLPRHDWSAAAHIIGVAVCDSSIAIGSYRRQRPCDYTVAVNAAHAHYAAKAAANAAASIANGQTISAAIRAGQIAVAKYDGSGVTPRLMLDGVLAIGPQSPGFSPEVTERVAAYRELVRT